MSASSRSSTARVVLPSACVGSGGSPSALLAPRGLAARSARASITTSSSSACDEPSTNPYSASSRSFDNCPAPYWMKTCSPCSMSRAAIILSEDPTRPEGIPFHLDKWWLHISTSGISNFRAGRETAREPERGSWTSCTVRTRDRTTQRAHVSCSSRLFPDSLRLKGCSVFVFRWVSEPESSCLRICSSELRPPVQSASSACVMYYMIKMVFIIMSLVM